jgi:protoporphyrinogen oxidase
MPPSCNGASPRPRHVVIIGGGFTGLSAGYELSRHGVQATVVEEERTLGGLAGTFDVDGQPLEKFYHHWFTSDRDIQALVRELGAEDRIVHRPVRTGMYFANRLWKLSSPLDVLRFAPLRLLDRLRLGWLVLAAGRVNDWQALDGLTAEEWLIQQCGNRVYRIVWEPLLRGKFGELAPQVSAAWFWSKFRLRGSSRNRLGSEVLAYFSGGFSALADRMAEAIRTTGGRVLTGTAAVELIVQDGRAVGIRTAAGETIAAEAVIATPALPIIARLVAPHAPQAYVAQLQRIDYLANVCLVLQLDRSLSDTYWLNVNDPSFPFVGIIEHTNFEWPSSYGNTRIVYLSSYLPVSDARYRLADAASLQYAIPHLKRMFPAFEPSWILRSHVWRARYAQPLVVRGYSRLVPPHTTPIPGFYIATMAQVYPEDRGTNYAVRDGRAVARLALFAATST